MMMGAPLSTSRPPRRTQRLFTLKKRADFQRVRGGFRVSMAAFLIEGKPRVAEQAGTQAGPRFGFTITKKLGNAVLRNRIRRRLREALSTHAAASAHDGLDYVIVARTPAATQDFAALRTDLASALKRIGPGSQGPPRKKGSSGAAAPTRGGPS